MPEPTTDEHEAKWAERDRRREETEAHYAAQAAAERDRLAKVIELALGEAEAGDYSDCAYVAVDALKADGVIFAYIGSFDDAT